MAKLYADRPFQIHETSVILSVAKNPMTKASFLGYALGFFATLRMTPGLGMRTQTSEI